MGNDLRKLLKALMDQGFDVQRTSKNRWSVYTFDGKWVGTVAGNPKEFHAWMNNITQLRRSGFTWPPKR